MVGILLVFFLPIGLYPLKRPTRPTFFSDMKSKSHGNELPRPLGQSTQSKEKWLPKGIPRRLKIISIGCSRRASW